VGLRFRIAGPENLEAVTGTINLAFGAAEAFFIDTDRIDLATVRDLAAKGSFILAYDADTLAGCVYAAPDGDRAYIGLLSVDPGRQRSGIGAALMDAAEEHCRKAGCRFVDLKVVNIREELPRFYRRRAYVETGTEPFPAFKNPKVACYFLIMTKALDQAASAPE
jgi:GNAT superfamily N-acetyltransferase